MTSTKISSLQIKLFCEKLAHLKKTHTLVSDIGSNSHRTDTNWNIHEGNHNDRIINYIHHMPERWTKFSQSRSEICVFFFLYKIVRYFSSHNGIPSIIEMVSSKTYFVYVADYVSFLMTPIKIDKDFIGKKAFAISFWKMNWFGKCNFW